jgi:flavin reductase (DIM6/NTAB) family NADH-FMN oxidoreductase RutF
MAVESRAFRDCCGRFATGVTVLTTAHGDHVHGMTANAFMSVSLDPPLVAVSVARRARMHELVQASGRYAVSILDESQEEVALHFAGRPRRLVRDAFAWAGDLPVVSGAVGHLVCDIVQTVAAGDHTLFVGEVRWLWHRDGRPLLFFEGRLFGLEGQPIDPAVTPLPFPLELTAMPAVVRPQGHTLVADYP